VPDPAPSCRAPTVTGAARLILRTNQPSQFQVRRSSLDWKWAKGQATTLANFGDPVHADQYSLCLYDSNPSTLLRATVLPGTSWRAKGQKGFTYRDRRGVADGLTNVDLRAGADGRAKIVVRAAKGPHLMLPALPLFPHSPCSFAATVSAGGRATSRPG